MVVFVVVDVVFVVTVVVIVVVVVVARFVKVILSSDVDLVERIFSVEVIESVSTAGALVALVKDTLNKEVDLVVSISGLVAVFFGTCVVSPVIATVPIVGLSTADIEFNMFGVSNVLPIDLAVVGFGDMLGVLVSIGVFPVVIIGVFAVAVTFVLRIFGVSLIGGDALPKACVGFRDMLVAF